MPLTNDGGDKAIVLLAFGSFSPVRRRDFEIMQRAREYYAWQGIHAIKGFFVPHGDDSFLHISTRKRLLEVAIQEEFGDNSWVSCYSETSAAEQRLTASDTLAGNIQGSYPGACIVNVVGSDVALTITHHRSGAFLVVPRDDNLASDLDQDLQDSDAVTSPLLCVRSTLHRVFTSVPDSGVRQWWINQGWWRT